MDVNGVDIEVERKPIKHIHLSVYPPDGRVHVSAPLNITDEQLRMFVLSKWVWMTGKIDKARSYAVRSPREYVSGEAHYFKGVLYRLRVDTGYRKELPVSIEGDYIVVRCVRRSQAEEIMKRWYRAELKEVLDTLVNRWVKRLGTPVPTYDVLAMQSSWGSCNKEKKTIMFNLELAEKPVECIEYVVAHEVVHLIEHNHTAHFYRLMDMYLPNWENLKRQLNEYPVTVYNI